MAWRLADLVRGHERLRADQRECLRQAEHLLQLLLREAFELRVPGEWDFALASSAGNELRNTALAYGLAGRTARLLIVDTSHCWE